VILPFLKDLRFGCNSDKLLVLPSERPRAGTEGQYVPNFFVGDEGLALNRYILRPFWRSNSSVKKKVTTVASADQEVMWNVLLEF